MPKRQRQKMKNELKKENTNDKHLLINVSFIVISSFHSILNFLPTCSFLDRRFPFNPRVSTLIIFLKNSAQNLHLSISVSSLFSSMMSRLLIISIAVLFLLQGATVAFQASTSLLRHPNLANTIVTQHKKYSPIATTSLQSSTTSDEDPYASPQLDTGAIAKYITAAATELGLFSATFQLLEIAKSTLDIKLPFAAIVFFFYACSLKSRVFNPLNNQRPDR